MNKYFKRITCSGKDADTSGGGTGRPGGILGSMSNSIIYSESTGSGRGRGRPPG